MAHKRRTRALLAEKDYDFFRECVAANFSDQDLGETFNLTERTAANWRVRLCGPKRKTPASKPARGRSEQKLSPMTADKDTAA